MLFASFLDDSVSWVWLTGLLLEHSAGPSAEAAGQHLAPWRQQAGAGEEGDPLRQPQREHGLPCVSIAAVGRAGADLES